jgi:5-methylcytosine-specific restriction enzyme A
LLVSCSYCGSMHPRKVGCKKKPSRIKEPNLLTRFRSSYQWQKKSKEIQKRDKYLCQYCYIHNQYTFDNIEVHHIESLEDNFDKRMDNNNLISLCAFHHKEAEAKKIDASLLTKIAMNNN